MSEQFYPKEAMSPLNPPLSQELVARELVARTGRPVIYRLGGFTPYRLSIVDEETGNITPETRYFAIIMPDGSTQYSDKLSLADAICDLNNEGIKPISIYGGEL